MWAPYMHRRSSLQAPAGAAIEAQQHALSLLHTACRPAGHACVPPRRGIPPLPAAAAGGLEPPWAAARHPTDQACHQRCICCRHGGGSCANLSRSEQRKRFGYQMQCGGGGGLGLAPAAQAAWRCSRRSITVPTTPTTSPRRTLEARTRLHSGDWAMTLAHCRRRRLIWHCSRP